MAKKRTDGYLRRSFTFNGKRYYVYGHNNAELIEKEQAKLDQLKKGKEKRDNPTVNEYYERWSVRREGTIKDSTWRGQEKIFGVVAKIKIPDAGNVSFGDLKIKEVTIDDLYFLQRNLVKDRHTQTTNDYLAHIKHFFRDALNERVIDYNPFVQLKDLQRTEELARDMQHRALTESEQKAFFEADETIHSSYRTVFQFAVTTGMRCGEIGALKRLDIRNGLIHVERSITRTLDGGYAIGSSAKTEAGKRSIPLKPETKEVLERQYARNAFLYGSAVYLEDTIFKAPMGGLLMATPADREIRRICKAIGIKPFTMHALRSTFATRCIEDGMSLRTLQEILGHKDINLTASLYGHVMEETKIKEMSKMRRMAI